MDGGVILSEILCCYWRNLALQWWHNCCSRVFWFLVFWGQFGLVRCCHILCFLSMLKTCTLLGYFWIINTFENSSLVPAILWLQDGGVVGEEGGYSWMVANNILFARRPNFSAGGESQLGDGKQASYSPIFLLSHDFLFFLLIFDFFWFGMKCS